MPQEKTLIYHITHINNLKGIIERDGLIAQSIIAREPIEYCNIAHNTVQDRREHTNVPLQPGGKLHDYVPFYFAPRSPILYAIHMKNVADCTATQLEIVYLVSSVENVAQSNMEFVFTDGHAIMAISDFYRDLDDLRLVDWNIMEEKYWADTDDDPDRKRRRQAEFLVYEVFPWENIEYMAVISNPIKAKVENIIANASIKHHVLVKPEWYY